MKQLFTLQAMNSNFIKLSQLFFNGPESSDLHSIKMKLEDIQQKTTIRMGKLESSSIDLKVKKCYTTAITTSVSYE